MWSHCLQRPAAGRELLLSLGVPCVGRALSVGAAKPTCCFLKGLTDLTSAQITQLSGNAMHMASLGAWVMYCLSNLMHKDDLIGNFKHEHHMLHGGGSSSCLDCGADSDREAADPHGSETGKQVSKRRRSSWPARST